MKHDKDITRFNGFFIIVLALVAMGCLANIVYGIETEKKKRQEQAVATNAYRIDSLRRVHQELSLKTLEDSVHFYEDGY